MLLASSAWGASIGGKEDSPPSPPSSPAADTTNPDASTSSDSSSPSTDEQNARIGLYMQKLYGYSVGPMGGNSAFYLSSLPASGYADAAGNSPHGSQHFCISFAFQCSTSLLNVSCL